MIKHLTQISEWLKRFVEYYIDDPSIDGGETDAQMLNKALPYLNKAIKELQKKPKIEVKSHKMSYEEWLKCPDFKDYIFTLKKDARESVNPHFRYCVVDENVNECYLTDDIGVAMEFAATKSKGGKMWHICRIFEARDKSYKTTIEGFCANGHYIERKDSGDYLHIDFIFERCEDNIKKL